MNKNIPQLSNFVICRKCGTPTKNKNHYCDDCQEFACNWITNQRFKGSAKDRGYGYLWKKLRKRILDRDLYICQNCLKNNKYTPATEVDHIIPKSQGGTDDKNNLQSLCKECHKEKTLKESRLYDPKS